MNSFFKEYGFRCSNSVFTSEQIVSVYHREEAPSSSIQSTLVLKNDGLMVIRDLTKFSLDMILNVDEGERLTLTKGTHAAVYPTEDVLACELKSVVAPILEKAIRYQVYKG